MNYLEPIAWNIRMYDWLVSLELDVLIYVFGDTWHLSATFRPMRCI